MIANTKRQSLHEHLYAVAVLSRHIARLKTDNPNIQQCAFMAGIYHDQGKIDEQFQSWVGKSKLMHHDNGQHIESGAFSFEKHARHNELSTWTFAVLVGADRVSKRSFLKNNGFTNQDIRLIDIIKHAIYWHHAKPLRDNDFQDLGAIKKTSIHDVSSWITKTNTLMQQMQALSSELSTAALCVDLDDLQARMEDIASEPLPAYKSYRLDHDQLDDYLSDVHYNSCCNIVRSSLVCADKIISSLSAEELTAAIAHNRIESLFDPFESENTLSAAIEVHSATFYPRSERSKKQQAAAVALANKKGVAALSGAAGCGKTKIALEWARERGARKLYWVVPRVSVALGLYHEISADDYLPSCRVEVFTSEYKTTTLRGSEFNTPDAEQLTGDVVITTIDQLVNAISTHRHINIFTDFMLNHAVFDEFHELIHLDALNLLFAEIVESKKNPDEPSNLLLVSATPNYTFCESLLGIEPDDFVEMSSSNNSQYEIDLEDFCSETSLDIHPLYRTVPDDSIVINNTATRAQLSYLHSHLRENSVLFHSKLASEDRKSLFNSVFNAFKRHGDRKFSVLRSAPIVQASLNITCKHMVTEATTPENLLQRLGRLDRFGEFPGLNRFVVAVPSSVRKGKVADNEAKFLNSMNVFYTTSAWINYLSEQSLSDVKLPALYDLYKEFHARDASRKIIVQDLMSALRHSAQSVTKKMSDPLWIKPQKNKKTVLKKSSLRGDSCYVQMIRASFDDDGLVLGDDFAFSEDNQMTLSLHEFDNGDDSPLNFMSRKHHQITGEGTKYSNHSVRLKDAARSSESPIFTSYPPAKLAALNEVNAPSSLVYVFTERQVVGCMRLKTIHEMY